MSVQSANGIESWVVDLAGRPVTYIAVVVILALGAVITLLPTQSLVVAVGALLIAHGNAIGPLMLLAASTLIGMIAGDLLAYAGARFVLRIRDAHRQPARHQPRVVGIVEARIGSFRSRFERNPR